jgi:hypothetical membrane protein
MDARDDQGPAVRALILCGLLSTLLYVIVDLVGALNYPGYDYAAQAISEMSAVGAPTADLLAPIYRIWSLLFLAFAAGLWRHGRTRQPLRWTAGFLIAVAIVGVGFALFPMNPRSAEPTFSDTMHLLVAGITMLLLTGAILAGATALGPAFRRYSMATVAMMLLFFGLSMRDVPNLGTDLPTPYLGLNERISMAAWLLWIAVLSVRLSRSASPP